MLFDLRASWADMLRKVDSGELSVFGINNIDDKVVVVLRKEEHKGIDIVDITDPDEPVPDGEDTPPVDNTVDAVCLDSEGRVIDEDGSIFCRFCGNSYSSRGITRHENKCSENPANQ